MATQDSRYSPCSAFMLTKHHSERFVLFAVLLKIFRKVNGA